MVIKQSVILENNVAVQKRLGDGRGIGAGDGNRTRTASLEGWNSTVELHPQDPKKT